MGKASSAHLIRAADTLVGTVKIVPTLPALIMTVPILLPVANQLGIDPVHFGIILVANMGVGLFLPPIGIGVLIGCSIGKVGISEVAKPLFSYLTTSFTTVLLITNWPGLTLVVPNLLFK